MVMKLQISYDKNVPKTDSNHTCLVLISWDSALKKDVNYIRKYFSKNLTLKRLKFSLKFLKSCRKYEEFICQY